MNPEPEAPTGGPLIVASHYFWNDMPPGDVTVLGQARYQVGRPLPKNRKIRVEVHYSGGPDYNGRVDPQFADRPTLSADEVFDAVCPDSPKFWSRFDEAYTLEAYIFTPTRRGRSKSEVSRVCARF